VGFDQFTYGGVCTKICRKSLIAEDKTIAISKGTPSKLTGSYVMEERVVFFCTIEKCPTSMVARSSETFVSNKLHGVTYKDILILKALRLGVDGKIIL